MSQCPASAKVSNLVTIYCCKESGHDGPHEAASIVRFFPGPLRWRKDG